MGSLGSSTQYTVHSTPTDTGTSSPHQIAEMKLIIFTIISTSSENDSRFEINYIYNHLKNLIDSPRTTLKSKKKNKMAQAQSLPTRVLSAMGCRPAHDQPDPAYRPDTLWGCSGFFDIREACPVCASSWEDLTPESKPTFRFECTHPICTTCHKGMKDSGRSMRCPLCRADENKSIVFHRCKSCGRLGHKNRASKQCPLHAQVLMEFILGQVEELEQTRYKLSTCEYRLKRTNELLNEKRDYYAKHQCKSNVEIDRLKRDLAVARSHSSAKLAEENKMLRRRLDSIAKLSEL